MLASVSYGSAFAFVYFVVFKDIAHKIRFTPLQMLWSSIFVTLVAKNILFRLRHSCFMWSSVTIITMWAHIIVFNI